MGSGQVKKVLGITAMVLLGAQAAQGEDRVIYGEDNRLDIYDVTDSAYLEYAKATAMLMTSSQIRSAGGNLVNFPTSTLQQNQRVCADEPFAQQPTPGWCSGFLVGEDILVTAGHCINSQSRCNTTSFVFGYAVSTPGNTPDQMSRDNVYTCKEIIKTELSGDKDFAVIRLDRKVQDVTPLKFRTSGKVATGEDLVLIGHPSGLPSKVADGGFVRSNSNANYFVATTDSYGGNSGSAVINANTGEVEGILVRGEDDYVSAPGRSCSVSNVCTEAGCRGEDVSRATDFAPFVPASTTTPPVTGDQVIVSVAPSIAIPDADSAGVSVDLSVADAGIATKVSVDLNITHTYIGDLTVTLTSPSGKQAVLHARSGGSTDNINQTYDVVGLVGEGIEGVWTLSVADTASLDIGKISSVKLTLSL